MKKESWIACLLQGKFCLVAFFLVFSCLSSTSLSSCNNVRFGTDVSRTERGIEISVLCERLGENMKIKNIVVIERIFFSVPKNEAVFFSFYDNFKSVSFVFLCGSEKGRAVCLSLMKEGEGCGTGSELYVKTKSDCIFDLHCDKNLNIADKRIIRHEVIKLFSKVGLWETWGRDGELFNIKEFLFWGRGDCYGKSWFSNLFSRLGLVKGQGCSGINDSDGNVECIEFFDYIMRYLWNVNGKYGYKGGRKYDSAGSVLNNHFVRISLSTCLEGIMKLQKEYELYKIDKRVDLEKRVCPLSCSCVFCNELNRGLRLWHGKARRRQSF